MRTIIQLALLGLALPAFAEFTPMATAVPDSVPNGMNYQGRLEKDGFPVTGNRAFTFRLYDASSGGTALYTSGILAIPVQQGLFAASLDIPFGSLTGTAQKYLEIEVEGVVLSPRDPLRSVPYAKVAETVEGIVNISTAGLTFTTNVGDSLAISSQSGRVGVGTSAPLARLHVSSGAGETGILVLVSTGASALVTIDGNGVVASNGITTGFITVKGTLTVQGNAFSVGGSDFVVSAGRVGIGNASPGATLTLVGDFSASAAATFASSVTVAGAANIAGLVGVGTTNPQTTLEVNGSAQFGAAATKSTFAATGALALNTNASLTVGTTFFVNNGRVGVGTASPSANSKLHVIGDVLIGNPAVHDTSANSDLLIDGNIIIDGKLVQHSGSFSVFEQLGVAAEPQANQTFAVGFTSFSVTTGGNVGVNVLSPLAKLTVNGDSSFSQPSTFASSVTVVGAMSSGGNLGVGTVSPASKLSVVGDLSVSLPATFASSFTVKQAAQFGSTGVSAFTSAGALNIAATQDITLSGAGAEVLGLPATPSATGAASKEYVDSQTLVGSGWTRDLPNTEVELSFIGDQVGVGTASPLAKLHVVGDMSVTLPATFGSSVTVRNAAAFGTTGQAAFSNTGVLTLTTPLATGEGGTGNATGNAPTASLLNADPTDCTLPNVALGINTAGTAQCSTPSNITGTAASLAADPTDCTLPNVALGINAAGTAQCSTPSNVTGNAATATNVAATGVTGGTLGTTVVAQTVQLVSANIVTLMGTAPGVVGKLYYCSDCTGGVGGVGAVVVSTGAAAGQFAISDGGPFQ